MVLWRPVSSASTTLRLLLPFSRTVSFLTLFYTNVPSKKSFCILKLGTDRLIPQFPSLLWQPFFLYWQWFSLDFQSLIPTSSFTGRSSLRRRMLAQDLRREGWEKVDTLFFLITIPTASPPLPSYLFCLFQFMSPLFYLCFHFSI